MCGVVGLLIRERSLEPLLGSMLGPMIAALDERGPDSSGIALYADDPYGTDTPLLRVSLGADTEIDWLAVGCSVLDQCGQGAELHRFGAGLVVDVPELSFAAVKQQLLAEWPEVRVLGIGQNLPRPQGHGEADRHVLPLRHRNVGGLPRGGPHKDGYGIGRHRPALTPFRARSRSLRRTQRLVLQLRHRPQAARGGRDPLRL